MKRPDFLAGSLAAFAAPTIVSAQAPAKLRVATTADVDSVGLLYADQAGLFRNARLDVEIVRMYGSPDITAALIGGSLDVGKAVSTYSTSSSLTPEGTSLLIEGPASLYSAGVGDVALIVANKLHRSQKRPTLNGKTVATNGIGDYLSLATMGWVDSAGGDSKSLRALSRCRARRLPRRSRADASTPVSSRNRISLRP